MSTITYRGVTVTFPEGQSLAVDDDCITVGEVTFTLNGVAARSQPQQVSTAKPRKPQHRLQQQRLSRRIKATQEQITAILAGLDMGKTYVTLSKEVGLNKNTVGRIARREGPYRHIGGEPKGVRRRGYHLIPEFVVNNLIELRKAGASYGDLSGGLSIGSDTLSKIFTKHNLRGVRGVAMSAVRRRRARDLLSKGKTPVEVGKQIGINPLLIYYLTDDARTQSLTEKPLDKGAVNQPIR